jgi:hypothetical protein
VSHTILFYFILFYSASDLYLFMQDDQSSGTLGPCAVPSWPYGCLDRVQKRIQVASGSTLPQLLPVN